MIEVSLEKRLELSNHLSELRVDGNEVENAEMSDEKINRDELVLERWRDLLEFRGLDSGELKGLKI